MTLPTNYTPWIFGFAIFQFVYNAVFSLIFWWSNKQKVTNTRFQEQDTRIAKIETDIKLGTAETEAETRLRQERHLAVVKRLEEIADEVARHADCKYHQEFEQRLDETNKEIGKVNGSVKHIEGVVEGRMKGIGSALDMIQQHLISNGGK